MITPEGLILDEDWYRWPSGRLAIMPLRGGCRYIAWPDKTLASFLEDDAGFIRIFPTAEAAAAALREEQDR